MRLPSKSKQDELVNGYIREKTTTFPFTIPICINQLCLSFFNTIQYFIFEKETLQHFLASTVDDEWEGEQFEINGISFQFILRLNYFTSNLGQIEFFVRIAKFESCKFIHKIIINGTFFCQETESFYTQTSQQSTISYNNRFIDLFGTTDMVSLLECKDKKSLTFCGDIKILQIEYKLHIGKSICNKSNIQMKASNNYCKWKINKSSFDKIQHFGQYIDDQNWLLFYQGPLKFRFGGFALRLLRLPANIVYVSAKCKMKIQYYDNNNGIIARKTQIYDHVFTYATNTRGFAPLFAHAESMYEYDADAKYDEASRKLISFILVECEIEIYEAFKKGCVAIQEEHWGKYGIIV